MTKKYLKHINLLVLTVALPFVYGCGGAGGGGIGALTGFLFGGAGSSVGLFSSAGSSLPLEIASAAEVAAIHNPEPATMLLLGSGMMAMTYFKSRKNRNS